MGRFLLMMRMAILQLLACVLSAGFFFAFFGVRGAIAGWIAAAALMTTLHFVSEARVLYFFSSKMIRLPGLPQTFKRFKIKVVDDPAPWGFAIRSLGSSGTLVVSHGLVSVLDEDEIAETLTLLYRKGIEMSAIFDTACLFISLSLLKLLPKGWTRLEGPIRAILVLIIVSGAKYFVHVSGKRKTKEVPTGAMRKIERLRKMLHMGEEFSKTQNAVIRSSPLFI